MSSGRALLAAVVAALLVSRSLAAVADDDVHIVADGETLSEIAARYFGNPHLWPALYRANRDQIKDPAQLYPGQSLRLPEQLSTRTRSTPPEGRREGRLPRP